MAWKSEIDVTSWAERCGAARRAQSSWCREITSLSCRRSRLVCGWWSGPAGQRFDLWWANVSGCSDLTGLINAENGGNNSPQQRWHHSPNLCWSPEGFPSHPPEKKPQGIYIYFSWRHTIAAPSYEGGCAASTQQDRRCSIQYSEGQWRHTRQCSFPWFSQWPVLPVRMILWSWLVFTQMISSTCS